MVVICNDSDSDSDDEQLKQLDMILCNSDSLSDEYYSNCELDTESLIWKHMSFPWFQYLIEGIKTWDIRLNKNDWNKIAVGELILYYGDVDNCRKVCCMKIIDIKKYPYFTDLIKEISLNSIFPQIASDIDANNLFHKWYNQNDEKEYGVIAINLEKIY